MKIEKIIIIACLLVSSCSYGASCRSGTAAAEGAQSAYDAAIAKINTETDALKNSSEVIGTCISAVTGVVTMPTFPDLGSIWSDIKNQVCKTASDKISGSYNEVIGGINNNINDLMNGMNNTVDTKVNDAKGSAKNIWN